MKKIYQNVHKLTCHSCGKAVKHGYVVDGAGLTCRKCTRDKYGDIRKLGNRVKKF